MAVCLIRSIFIIMLMTQYWNSGSLVLALFVCLNLLGLCSLALKFHYSNIRLMQVLFLFLPFLFFLSFSFCFIFWKISQLVLISSICSYFSYYIFTFQEFFGSLIISQMILFSPLLTFSFSYMVSIVFFLFRITNKGLYNHVNGVLKS